MAKTINPQFLRPLAAPGADVGHAIAFGPDRPLALDGGQTLAPWTAAYMTYGKLNAARSNAVLLCHALSGDQFAGGCNPVTGKQGWWPYMVGPGTARSIRIVSLSSA